MVSAAAAMLRLASLDLSENLCSAVGACAVQDAFWCDAAGRRASLSLFFTSVSSLARLKKATRALPHHPSSAGATSICCT